VNIIFFLSDSLEPVQKRAAVVQQSVHNYTRAQGKREEIRHRERSGQIKGRVILVGSHIECILRREYPRYFVLITEAIIGPGAEHREVRKIPGLETREETRKGGIRNTYICVV